jgi:hypothetical protein
VNEGILTGTSEQQSTVLVEGLLIGNNKRRCNIWPGAFERALPHTQGLPWTK